MQQTIPLLNSVIDNDRVGSSGPTPDNSLWKPEENNVRPRVLTRLQTFIEVASKNDQYFIDGSSPNGPISLPSGVNNQYQS